MCYDICIKYFVFIVIIIGSIAMPFSNISLLTKYKTDKIVFSKTGSVDISTLPEDASFGNLKYLSIPHGMPRPLFITFRFKIDADTEWRTGGSAEIVLGKSTATDLVLIMGYDLTIGTIYYEVFGSWIDDYDNTNPLVNVSNLVSNKLFDSRLNYRKIILQDSIDIPGDYSIINIPHGLLYSPYYQVYFDGLPNEVWQTHSGGVQDVWNPDGSFSDCIVKSSSSNLVISGHGRTYPPLYDNEDIRVWYRIFGDV